MNAASPPLIGPEYTILWRSTRDNRCLAVAESLGTKWEDLPKNLHAPFCLCHIPQDTFINSKKKRKIVRAGRRGGKAQPLDAKIYTPQGPTTMGDVNVGQSVLTPDGGAARVAAIYPQGLMDIYRVTFGDGGSTETTADHLWEIEETRTDSKWKNRTRLVTTAQLANMPTTNRRSKGLNRRPSVPVTRSVAFCVQPVPLQPYLLGALLGDGGFTQECLRITSADAHILKNVEQQLPPGLWLRRVDPPKHDYHITGGRHRFGRGKRHPIISALRSLGLWGKHSHEKFIPPIYKYNSIEMRLELLRGLLDTDGSVDHSGQPKFEQTSPQLARDFCEVMESLGGLVTHREKMGAYKIEGVKKETRMVYRQAVLYPDASKLFTLPAKRKKARPRHAKMRRFVHRVELVRKDYAQCIELDSDRGLYLTDRFIVTHNTTGIARLCGEAFIAGKRVLYAAPTADQLTRFWYEIKRMFEDPIEHGIFYKNETNHIIELAGTQQRIRAKTAWNADTLRGDFADLLVLDEWQLMNEDAWRLVGAPMLLDNNGDAVFIYTPPSLTSRIKSQASDPLHAAKMFMAAQKDERWLTLHFTSHQNPHLSMEGLLEVTKDMTQMAIRQEIYAEDVMEVPGSLWKQWAIDALRVKEIPAAAMPLVRIVVAVDPTGSTTNEAGIVGAGLGRNGHGYLINDKSLLGSPAAWSTAAVRNYYELEADRIVGEMNYGGDMVENTIRTVRNSKDEAIGEGVSYKNVDATRGKQVRAEPICAYYERGLILNPDGTWAGTLSNSPTIHHVGHFPKLEEEMTSYVPGVTKQSPNRMDALVWAFTDLMPINTVLGLIEYGQSGQMERDMEEKKTEKEIWKIEGPTDLAKPVIADEAPKCPNCESTLVQIIAGGQRRCMQCAKQWWDNGDRAIITPPASRKDFLK